MNTPSIYYVFLDATNQWLGDDDSPEDEITNAREFDSLASAQRVAEQHEGMVLGWYQ